MLVRLPHLRQPQDYTGVNDDSPLTQGLVELVVPHWRRSSATGKPMIPGSTGGSGYRTWRAGRYGIHRHLDRANVAEDRYRIETGVTGDFTLFLLGGTDGALGATQRMLLLQTTVGTRRAAMGEEGGSKFAGETNPSGGSSVTATESTTTLGEDHLYALRLSGTAQTLWVDGVQVASATQATNNFSDVGQMSLNTTGFLSGGSGRIYLCGFAARAWTDQEMALAAANPWAMFAPRRIWVPTPSGGTSLPVGLATETDTAYATTGSMAGAPGLATETDTAYARSGAVIGAAGLALETDAAFALTPTLSGAAGLSTETDTASALVASMAGAAGLATETDTAFALSQGASLPVGLATETDVAYARTGSVSGTAGLAAETDTAYSRTGAMAGATGLATETDSAYARSGAMAGTVGLATETDAALALGGVVSGAVGLATETDAAFALGTGTALPVGLAVETDSAYALAGAMAGAVGLATETDTAFALEVSSSTIRRPNSDILTTGWTAVPGGSLYDMIDEASPNDADYITRAQAGTEPAIFGIPQVPAGPNTIRIRAAATSGSGQVRVLLLDSSGSTVGTSAWQSIDATPTTYALSVVASAAAERVRIEAS